jgi:hypothetical protein
MAHIESFPASAVAGIAQQIGQRLPGLVEAGWAARADHPEVRDRDQQLPGLVEPSLLEARVELCESLPLWMLPADILRTQTDAKLSELAQPTGRWHHQIQFNGAAKAFARSLASSGSSESPVFDHGWVVRELYVSDLADQIARGLAEIDWNDVPDSFSTRLLTAPAFHVEALWLVSGDASESDRVLPVRTPSESHVADAHILPAREFLERLRLDPVARGIRIASEEELPGPGHPFR